MCDKIDRLNPHLEIKMTYSATFFKNYKLLSEYKYKLGDLEKG